MATTSAKVKSSDESINDNSDESSPIKLTQEQIERIEKNRKRALDIKLAKENAAKMPKLTQSNASVTKKLVDTGAGFFIDEEELIEEKKKTKIPVEEPPIPVPDEHLTCQRCSKKFPHSFLSTSFDCEICDSCKNEFPDDYKLITRTDAKAEFLLKDCDFDAREPPLKYIIRKNPHNQRFAEMKLYLRSQCSERALLVHETEESLEEKKELKVINLHKTRQKNYEKKVTALRKEARLGARKTVEFHKHEYGEEIFDEKEDKYYKICKSCSFKLEYEEL